MYPSLSKRRKFMVLILSMSLLDLLGVFMARPALGAIIIEWDVPGETSSLPYDLLVDPSGNVWFTEYGSDELGRMWTGIFKEYKLPPGSRPWGISNDGDFFWFTMSIRNAIGRIDALDESKFLEFPLNSSLNPEPRGIYACKDGSNRLVWFTEYSRHGIALLNLTGSQAVMKEWLLPSRGDRTAGPQMVIYVAEEGLSKGAWYVDFSRDVVGHIPNPSQGYIREYYLPSDADPWDLDVDSYGHIWFTESGRNRIGKLNPNTNEITEYLISTPNSEPYGLAIDQSNKVWFTMHGVNKIGRFTPGVNTLTEFSRSVNGAPMFITLSQDRSPPVWFTDDVSNRIGKLGPFDGLTTVFSSTLSAVPTSSTTIPASKTTLSTGTYSTAYTSYTTSSKTQTLKVTEATETPTSYTGLETITILQTSTVQVVTETSAIPTEVMETLTATSTFYEATVTETKTATTTIYATSTSYVATTSGTYTATLTLTSYSTIYASTTGEMAAIPGFPSASIILGITMALLILAKSKRGYKRTS